MLVEIDHRIRYSYSHPVSLSRQTIRLRPSVKVDDYRLTLHPDVPVSWTRGPRGNSAAIVGPQSGVKLFKIMSRFSVDVDASPPKGIGSLMDACRSVHEKVRYISRYDEGVQEPRETLTLGTGTCRDIAWLLVSVLREQGSDARFVSGYCVQPGPPLAADLHAWVEVLDRGRWVGLDPTLCAPVGGCHIPIASARHPGGAAPVSGKIEPEEDCLFGWGITCRPCTVAA